MEPLRTHRSVTPILNGSSRSVQRTPTTRLAAGFTLVELMVVAAIIVVVMAIVFSGQSSFNKSLVLSNTAYDVALSLRSAETFGLGSRATASNVKNAGYGIHFDKETPNSFILFADTTPVSSDSSACHPNADASAPNAQPGDCVYDLGEQVTVYTLGNGISISNFCAFSDNGHSGNFDWRCAYDNSGGGEGGSLHTLDIVFARPNPDPFMSANNSYSELSTITAACVALSSLQGGEKYVSVAASGEITAHAASCGDGSSAPSPNPTPPTGLVLSHLTRSKAFSVSWVAGTGNGGAGGCKLQFNADGSTWTDISSATSVNCDASSNNVVYALNGDGWKANWGATQMRIVRTSDSSTVGTFAQTLSCASIAGSSSPTPMTDEDCDGNWDNTETVNCSTVCTNPNGTMYSYERWSIWPTCSGTLFGISQYCMDHQVELGVCNGQGQVYLSNDGACCAQWTQTCDTLYK